MKGNKMSAILAILLMLSGAIFIPHAFAVVPAAAAVQANPLSVSYQYPTKGPGSTFDAFVDVVNVTGLFAFQAGFYFDKNYLQVVAGSVKDGGFLTNNGLDGNIPFPGSIDNVNGVVKAYGWTLTNASQAKTGSGHLLNVTFQIKNTLWPPYTDGAPGGPVVMMHFVTTVGDVARTKLVYQDGSSVIPINALHDGSFTLFVVPAPPVAFFTISPAPPYYVGDVETEDASGSTKGWNGYNYTAIVNYHWDFGDGNVTNTSGPIVTHSYATAGSYTITLIVTDADGRVSQPFSRQKLVSVRPTGCVLDVFTQGWRYIDPFTYTGVLQGKGSNFPAEMFRPGDLVQLFATTVYNGDPVNAQFVAYEVLDAQNNVVLLGNGLTNTGGLAEIDFRIPWPQDVNNPAPIFGTWKVNITWEIGSNSGLPPFAKTQVDNMTFNVGWGVWSSDLNTTLAEYHKGDIVTVNYKIHNDYAFPINVLTTAVMYDDLMVPIGWNGVQQMFLPGVTDVHLQITIPVWAFVGVGTIKANEYSTWPFSMGVAFGPEQLWNFAIKHTFNPADP